jgi:hypothetical protein
VTEAPPPEVTREDAELALLAAAEDPRVAGLSGHSCAVALLHVLSEEGWLVVPRSEVESRQGTVLPDGGVRPDTWRQVTETQEDTLRQLMRWCSLMLDMDRNENGRHEGDLDVGDATGVSRGNPHLRPGAVIGYTIGGRQRPIIVPDREHRHRPEAWTPRPDS